MNMTSQNTTTETESATILTPDMFPSQETYQLFLNLTSDRCRLRMMRGGLRSSKPGHTLKDIRIRCGLTSRNINDMILEINHKIADFYR
jgi:hypothetical protein